MERYGANKEMKTDVRNWLHQQHAEIYEVGKQSSFAGRIVPMKGVENCLRNNDVNL